MIKGGERDLGSIWADKWKSRVNYSLQMPTCPAPMDQRGGMSGKPGNGNACFSGSTGELSLSCSPRGWACSGFRAASPPRSGHTWKGLGRRRRWCKDGKLRFLAFAQPIPVVQVSSPPSVLAFQKSSLEEGYPPLWVCSWRILEDSPDFLRTLWLKSSTWPGRFAVSNGKIKFRTSWLFHSDVSQ